MSEKGKNLRTIGIVSFALINVCSVLSLRNLPVLATHGWGAIVWYTLFTICFLIPLALVSAELAYRFPKAGGMYTWNKGAGSKKRGFIPMWNMWCSELIWFPAGMSYLVIILTYSISSPWMHKDPLIMGALMLLGIWALTTFNILLNKYASRFITVGVAFGTLIPFAILILLTVAWLACGNTSNLEPFSFDALVPSLGLEMFTFIGSIIFVFTGMETAGYYISSTKNPRRTAPLATILSAVIILIVCICGTLSIATLLHESFLNGPNGINGGIIEAFKVLFDSFGISWLILPIGVMLVIGVSVQLLSLMDAPGKGLQRAAMDGMLPKFFHKMGKDGASTNIYLLHGTISSLFVIVYVLSINSQFNGYWILITLATMLVSVGYFNLFLSFLRSRKVDPESGLNIGGKHFGTVMAYTGMITIIVGFILTMIPPKDYGLGINILYVSAILILFVLMSFVVPMLFMKYWKPSWKADEKEMNKYLEYNNELE